MQVISDVASATLAIAILLDRNAALAVLATIASGHIMYLWWRRRRPAPDVATLQNGSDPAPAVAMVRRDELRAALAKLPTDQQRVLDLRFLQGLQMHEIAASTGLSYEAIRALQFQALTTLAKQAELRIEH